MGQTPANRDMGTRETKLGEHMADHWSNTSIGQIGTWGAQDTRVVSGGPSLVSRHRTWVVSAGLLLAVRKLGFLVCGIAESLFVTKFLNWRTN